MKEYTTLEMIEEIMVDRSITFKCLGVEDKDEVYYNGNIKWKSNNNPLWLSTDSYRYKWTKVQQSVPFMGAAEAFHTGKIIKVVYQNGKATNTYDPHKHGTLTDNHGGGITTDEILEGIWYIEE